VPFDPALSVRPAENVKIGIAYSCASAILVSFTSVLIKWLSNGYPAIELCFFRCAFGLIPVMLIVRHTGGVTALRTYRPFAQFFRAAVWACSFMFSFLSLHFLPLADAIALSFLAPLFMTVLSMPMLGERVGVHRWGAVLLGLVGILVMARPSGEVFQIGVVFGIGAAVTWAVGSLSVRHLTRTETAPAITFYTHVFGAMILGLMLPFVWETPSGPAFLGMVVIGLLGGVSQFWSTQALSYAPASAVAPFIYTQMVWAVIFGYVVWGDVPTLHLTAGVALIIASGLYILHREVQRNRIRPAA
jgi:drug/metabolite transporter (DMT)-like permease